MKIFLRTSIAFISFFLLTISKSFSQAGTLDSSFGANGKVTSNFGYANLTATASAIQNDGRIVVAGTQGVIISGQANIVVARYNTNGNLDLTFGNNGKVNTYFDTGDYTGCVATTILIQPDKKILVGGYVYHPFVGPDYFALVRYLPNGNLDSTFGKDGKVMDFIGPYPKENELLALVLLKDGKILAAGYSDGGCLVRYNPSGVRDSSFVANGVLRINGGAVHGLSVQTDGKILAAGSEESFLVSRFLPNGLYDSTFGINGKAAAKFLQGHSEAYAVNILDNGDIIASGATRNDSLQVYILALVKYKANGTIDSSFGINGQALTKAGGQYISLTSGNVLIQNDKKIVVAGNIILQNFMVWRFTSNGTTDSTFGDNGRAETNFGSTSNSYSIALLRDGKIIAAGIPYFSLARFKGDEPVTVSILKNISTFEGDSGTTPVTFRVVLNKPSTQTIKVHYATKDGTAKAGSDYVAKSETLTLKPGQVAKNIVVNLIGDNVVEPNEKFYLQLSNPQNAILGTLSTATCLIKNDDAGFTGTGSGEDNFTINKNAITLYPNPVKDVLKLQGLNTNKKTTISIVDVQGKVVMKTTASNTSSSLNVKQLQAGTYLVKIESDNHVTTLKFVKE